MATKEKIEDFGEEIFGARKHLAQLNRELRVSDLEGWTDAERQENINKDTAFPKVNYKKEYENGKDRTVLFYIKKLRDSLPKEPAYPPKRLRTPEQHEMDKRQAQESYLTTISYVYQKAMKLEKPSDCTFFMNEVMREHLPDKEKILQKTNFNLNLDNRYNQFSFSKELQKKQFLYSDKEKILSKYTIGQYDGKNIQNEERLGNAKEVLLGQWEQKNKSILAGTFKLSLGSDNVTAMLKSDVMKEWFALNGISEEVQAQSFHHKTDSKATWSKVDSAKMKDVIALQESCAASIASKHPDEKIIASVYETAPKRKNNKSYTFLNIVKDEGLKEENPKLSVSFSKDGTPLTINYNNQFAYNIAARTTSDDYHKVLWNDPTFRELFNIAVDGLQERGLDKGIEKFGEISYKSTDSYEKVVYTPVYNAVPMPERKLTDSSIDFKLQEKTVQPECTMLLMGIKIPLKLTENLISCRSKTSRENFLLEN